MQNKTKKVAVSLVVAGIALCGSVAIGATSAEASSAFGNWNENDVASYDTDDAYGAVRSGSAWNENDSARHNGTCDAYVDADGDGICDNCLCDDCVAKGDGACQNAQGGGADGRCYVDADGDGICDNCGNRACRADGGGNACDGTGKQVQHRTHHSEHGGNSTGGYGHGGHHRNCR